VDSVLDPSQQTGPIEAGIVALLEVLPRTHDHRSHGRAHSGARQYVDPRKARLSLPSGS